MTQQLILGEVARTVGVKPYQIAYAISCGMISEPKLRIAGKRIFSMKEVQQVRKYFDSKAKKGGT